MANYVGERKVSRLQDENWEELLTLFFSIQQQIIIEN